MKPLLVQQIADRLQSGGFFSVPSIKERLDWLKRLATAIRANEASILAALKADLGKPALEAYLSEVYFVLEEIRLTRRHLRRWARPRRVRPNLLNQPSIGWIQPEPYGRVLILGPWNYPFQLVMGPLVSAIAAGNRVVLKPSEHAPASAELTERLLRETFPPERVTVVTGDAEVARSLLQIRFDYIFFTGNAGVGREVMAAAAGHLTPLTLELGGKCPCLITAQAPLEPTVRRVLRGKFFNAGQTCVAPDYACIHRSRYDAFLALARQTIQRFYGANPVDSPDYASIVSRRHFDRLQRLAVGATEMVGQHDRERLRFAPVLMRDVDWDDLIMEEEIFGPILPCLAYDDLDDVLRRLRERPKPLALYLFSPERSVQRHVVDTTSSGGVCLNDTLAHITSLNLPFGGVGASGMGSYHGRHGFETFSHFKSVMRKPSRFELFSAYPPYGSRLNGIKRFLRFLRRD